MLFSSDGPRQTQRDALRVRGEEERGLAGRVAGADDVDVLAVDVARLAARRAVEEALAREPLEARDRQLAPGDAAGEDDRLRADHVAAVEVDLLGGRVDPLELAGHEDLGAEPAGLLERAAGELVAGDAVGEAEVVLDPRRRAGLAARRLALDDERAQALRRAVDRGGEARGPGADDDRVVAGVLGLRAEVEQVGDAAVARPDHGLAVDDAERRQVVLLGERAAPQLLRVGDVRGDPAERHLVAVEEAAQVGALRVPAVAEDDGARGRRVGGEALQAAQAATSGARRAARPPCRRRGRPPRPRGSRAGRGA